MYFNTFTPYNLVQTTCIYKILYRNINMAKDLLKIENVYFSYIKMDQPQKNKFDTSGLMKEFSGTFILTREQRKEFMALKLNKTVKEIDTSLFESKHKFAPPYPDQDVQYLLQVSTKATYKDGNPKPEWTYPKVYFQKDGSVIENTKVKVGNGSFGDVRLERSFNKTLNQTNVTLDSILVKEHIEFEGNGDEWASAAGIPTYVETPRVQDTQQGSVSTPTMSAPDYGDDLPF